MESKDYKRLLFVLVTVDDEHAKPRLKRKLIKFKFKDSICTELCLKSLCLKVWRHMKEKIKVWIWNVNMLSEILTLNQEFQFEAWSNNSKRKNLSCICQIDNEGHIPSFNLQCRLAGDSVQSLFRIAIFNRFIKTVKYEKGPYFKRQSGPYFKQSTS